MAIRLIKLLKHPKRANAHNFIIGISERLLQLSASRGANISGDKDKGYQLPGHSLLIHL